MKVWSTDAAIKADGEEFIYNFFYSLDKKIKWSHKPQIVREAYYTP